MIRIYPIYHLKASAPKFKATEGFSLRSLHAHKHKHVEYTTNAKAAIHAICRRYQLGRHDEVFIATTTDTPYVSTCVSATLFNYAKISRELSDQTRMIYVIHEFGVIHRSIDELQTLASQRKIPLIEDCAHSPMSHISSKTAGNWGDHCIYSLSKHFPLVGGGAVASKEPLLLHKNELADSQLVSKIERWIKFLPDISAQRKRIFANISSNFPQKIHNFLNADGSIPYFAILKSVDWERITRELDGNSIELGRTYNPNWICIPTQAFASEAEWEKVITKLRKCL